MKILDTGALKAFETVALHRINTEACNTGYYWFQGKSLKEAYETCVRPDWIGWLIREVCMNSSQWLFNALIDTRNLGGYRESPLWWLFTQTRFDPFDLTIATYQDFERLKEMMEHLRSQYTYEEFVSLMWADHYTFCCGEEEKDWHYVMVLSPFDPDEDLPLIQELMERYGTFELVPESFHNEVPLTYVWFDGSDLTEIATV